MKKRTNKSISLLLVSIMIISSLISLITINNVFAEDDGIVIESLTVDSSTVTRSNHVQIKGKVKANSVYENQKVIFDFQKDINDFEIGLPMESEQLTYNGEVLGTIEFDQATNQAIVIFNKRASEKSDIVVNFEFAMKLKTIGEDDRTIEIKHGNTTLVEIIAKGEKYTNSQSKTNLRKTHLIHEKPGDDVKWIFAVNETKEMNITNDSFIKIEDELDETMNWNKEYFENENIVYIEGYMARLISKDTKDYLYLTKEKAKEYGIFINLIGSKNIEIIFKQAYIEEYWRHVLSHTMINITLSANVLSTDSNNFVYNKIKSVDYNYIDNMEYDDREVSIKVQKQSADIIAKPKGTITIEKYIDNDSSKPIENVEFSILNEKRELVEVIKTDKNGIARSNNLKNGLYYVKETKAPEWIEFNLDDAKEQSIKIDNSLYEGEGLVISNSKKKIDIEVNKIWDGVEKTFDTEFNLYRTIKTDSNIYLENEEFVDSIKLTKDKTSHIWNDLDFSDDKGNQYKYFIEEVGAEDNLIEFTEDGKTYKFSVNTEYNINDENIIFNITNKLVEESKKITISAQKMWTFINENNHKPDVMFQLYRNNEKFGEPKVLKNGEGFVSWDELEYSDEFGKKYDYDVIELGSEYNKINLDGKTYSINKEYKEEDNTFIITNTEEPGTEEPGTEEPGTEEPDQPGTEEPDQPGTEEPEEPGTEEPEKPGIEEPEKPGTEEPEKPGIEEPDQPGTEEPEKPGTEEPGTEEPDQPGTEEPEKPGIEEPDQPGIEEPEKPGTEEPEKPGIEEPEKPGTEEPEKPEEPKEETKPSYPNKNEPERPGSSIPDIPNRPKNPNKKDPIKPEEPVIEEPNKPLEEEPNKPLEEEPNKPLEEEPKDLIISDSKVDPNKSDKELEKEEITEKDKVVKSNNKVVSNKLDSNKAPQTGDVFNIGRSLLVIFASISALFIISKKKKEN